MSFWIDVESPWLLRRPWLRRVCLWVGDRPWTTLLILAGTLGLLALALRPVYMPPLRDWKLQRDLNKAREAAAADDPARARDWASQVLRKDRGSQQEALVILTESLAKLGDPRAGQYALALWHDYPDLDRATRLEAWHLIGRYLPTRVLIGNWLSIEDEAQRFEPEILRPMLERCLSEGNPDLNQAVLSPLPPLEQAELEALRLRILMQSRPSRENGDFARNLAAATARFPDEGARWLPLVTRLTLPDLGPREREQMQRFLASFPADDPLAGLEKARFELALNRDLADWDARFERVVERYRDEVPVATARWARSLGRGGVAREVLGVEAPAAEPETLELQVELLLQDRQREAAADLLEQAVGEQMESWREALWKYWAASLREEAASLRETTAMWLDAAAARRLNLSTLGLLTRRAKAMRAFELKKTEALQGAVEVVTGSADPMAAIRLGQAADERGLRELARDAWTVAVRESRGPLPLYESLPGLLPALEQAGREKDMIAVSRRYLQLNPGNLSVKVVLAYLGLTNGLRQPDEVIEELQPLFERLPQSTTLAHSLALAHLLRGEPEIAEPLTEQEGIDWYRQPPGARAVRIAVLREVGRLEEAEVLAEGFRFGDLLPSEERIFRALLADTVPGIEDLPPDEALRAATPATADQRLEPAPEPDSPSSPAPPDSPASPESSKSLESSESPD